MGVVERVVVFRVGVDLVLGFRGYYFCFVVRLVEKVSGRIWIFWLVFRVGGLC